MDLNDDKITLRVEPTPSGRLLARTMQIMAEKGITIGEAMDLARAEVDNG
jgi:hypothetical protein